MSIIFCFVAQQSAPAAFFAGALGRARSGENSVFCGYAKCIRICARCTIFCAKLGRREAEKRLQQNDIEVIPLAFMRGLTLANTAIILDEAQNATIGQIKMLLTRLGRGGCKD